MRKVTATEKYRAVTEGQMAKKEFVRQMRLSHPDMIASNNTYNDTVKILSNRGLINEASLDRESIVVSDDSIRRALDIELTVLGCDPVTCTDSEMIEKARQKAIKTLAKDPLHYYNLIAGESSKVDKHDKEVEVKRGEAKQDTFNDMKKAELKEDKAKVAESCNGCKEDPCICKEEITEADAIPFKQTYVATFPEIKKFLESKLSPSHDEHVVDGVFHDIFSSAENLMGEQPGTGEIDAVYSIAENREEQYEEKGKNEELAIAQEIVKVLEPIFQSLEEADAIPTSPGKIEIGTDGEPHVTIASNAERKMALRKVIDILTIDGHPEKGYKVSNDEALSFIRTYKDEIFDGTIDFNDAEVIWDEYEESESIDRDDVGDLNNEAMSDEFMTQVANYGKHKGQKTYQLGDPWSDDFDYAGMLKAALKIRLNTPMKVMQQIYDSFEDVNYHRENKHLGAALHALKDDNKEEAAQHLKDHKKEIALTVKQLSESEDRNFVREGYYGQSNFEQIAGALGYDSLDEFLNDNPGATEGIVQWIGSIPEFRKKLSSEYSTSELEELGFYDFQGYDSEEDEEELNEKKVKENIDKGDSLEDIKKTAMSQLGGPDTPVILIHDPEAGDRKKYNSTLQKALAYFEKQLPNEPSSVEEPYILKKGRDVGYEEGKAKISIEGHLFDIIKKGVAEKKGKDQDGDGDVDGDDYKASKDKAIKKAMGKDEQLVKENLKSIITKLFEEKTLNEAATAKLADWGAGYESFPGVKPVVIELENIVTEVEQFYDKIQDKIANTFSKTAEFKNEEGLKIGAFIAPSLEAAFKQDLRPVIKSGFTSKVDLPKVKRITQSDVERGYVAETDVEEEKENVFAPTVNGTLRENKKK